MDVDMDPLDALAPGRMAGDLPAGGSRDREADEFEAGRSRRDQRREDNRFRRVLRDRDLARQEVAALRRQLAEAQADSAKSRVSEIEAEIEAAETEQRDAMADGDADRAAKATRRVAVLATDRKVAEIEAANAERTAKAAPADPAVTEWVQRNASWFQSKDPAQAKKQKLAVLAHEEARDVEGFAVGSPDYFRYIEERVEAKFPNTVIRGADDDEEDDDDEFDTQPPARVSPTRAGAAPVTRGASPTSARPGAGRRGRTMEATPEQVEAAKVSGVTIQEYMASAVALDRQGRTPGGRR